MSEKNFSTKLLITLLSLGIAGFTTMPAFALIDKDADTKINSLYAANKLDDAFNTILTVPKEMRTPLQWTIMGNIMLDYGNVSDAEFMYKEALKIDPKYHKALYNLGNIYLDGGKPNLAIQYYKQVTKYHKEFAYGYYNLGCAYLKIGEYKKARNAFLDATYFNNREPDFYYNLAYVYKKLNDDKSANTYLGFYNKLMENK